VDGVHRPRSSPGTLPHAYGKTARILHFFAEPTQLFGDMHEDLF